MEADLRINEKNMEVLAKEFEDALQQDDYETLEEVFSRMLFEYDEKDFEVGEIHVSSLGYCELKTVLQIAHNIKTPVVTKMAKGKLLHFGIESILRTAKEKGFFKEEIKFEDEVQVEYNLGNGWKIVGTPDVVIWDTVIDFKFSRLWENADYEHYRAQLNTYAVLLGKEKALLVVIDERDFNNVKVFPFEVSEELFEETVKKAKRIAKAVRDIWDGKIPSNLDWDRIPEFEWECRYCPVKDKCGKTS